MKMYLQFTNLDLTTGISPTFLDRNGDTDLECALQTTQHVNSSGTKTVRQSGTFKERKMCSESKASQGYPGVIANDIMNY